MAIPIGTLGTIPTLTIGGRVFTDLTTLIILGGWGASGKFATLRKPNGTSGYQVTSGKTLTIHATRAYSTSSPVADFQFYMSYTDTDIGMNFASNGTNPVYLFGDSSAANIGVLTSAAVDHSAFEYNFNFQVIAQKYCSVEFGENGSHILAYGYET